MLFPVVYCYAIFHNLLPHFRNATLFRSDMPQNLCLRYPSGKFVNGNTSFTYHNIVTGGGGFHVFNRIAQYSCAVLWCKCNLSFFVISCKPGYEIMNCILTL